MFRGSGLASLSYYEYWSTVYKTTLTPDEHRKLNIEKQNAKDWKSQPRWKFSTQHPQSDTHIQVVRSQPLIPSLSLLPPSEDSNSDKFCKCILLLFKPFVKFTDLFNGITWEDSYLNTNFSPHLSQKIPTSKKCILG